MLVRMTPQMSSIISVKTTSRSGYTKEQWVVTYNPTLFSMKQPRINLQSYLHSEMFNLGCHLEVMCNTRYPFLDLFDVLAYHLQTLLEIGRERSIVKSVQDVRLKSVRFRSQFRTCLR